MIEVSKKRWTGRFAWNWCRRYRTMHHRETWEWTFLHPPFTSQDCLLSMILRMVSLRAWWTNGVAVAFMYCSISVLANVVALNNVVASSGWCATGRAACQCTISGKGSGDAELHEHVCYLPCLSPCRWGSWVEGLRPSRVWRSSGGGWPVRCGLDHRRGPEHRWHGTLSARSSGEYKNQPLLTDMRLSVYRWIEKNILIRHRPLWTRCTPPRAWSSPRSNGHARAANLAQYPSEARESWGGTTRQSSVPSGDGSTGSAWTLVDRGNAWGQMGETVFIWKRRTHTYRCRFLCSFWFCCSGWSQTCWFHPTGRWNDKCIFYLAV